MESVINDVELLDLTVIPTDGGPVMHMMRPASPLFGEIMTNLVRSLEENDYNI